MRRRQAPALPVLLVLLLGANAGLALAQRGERATGPALTRPPPAASAAALGFGDPQLFYRQAALALQNAGDGGGRITAMRDYDYAMVIAWLELLDQVDPRARFGPTLASYYFSQTPVAADLRQIVEHLIRLAARDPTRHWRTLAHAIYLARHRLNDLDLALAAAERLARTAGPEVPIWTRQMPAFVLAETGEVEAARDLLETILATSTDLPADEAAFIRGYLDRRLALPSDRPSP